MIPLAIPSGCRISKSNGLRDARLSYLLDERRSQMDALRREQLRIEENIRSVEAAIVRSTGELETSNARLLPVTVELSDRLGFLTEMERDLAAAKKKHGAAQAEWQQLQKIGAAQAKTKAALAGESKKLKALQTQLAARKKEVLAVSAQIEEFQAMHAKIQGVLKEVRSKLPKAPQSKPAVVPAAKRPAKKKHP